MHVKKRRLPNFEACSVALFASIALGGTSLPSRAQAPSTPSSNSSRPAVPPLTGTAFLHHRQPSRTSNPIRTAPTAALEPTSDKDGSISSPNFDEALK